MRAIIASDKWRYNGSDDPEWIVASLDRKRLGKKVPQEDQLDPRRFDEVASRSHWRLRRTRSAMGFE